MRTLLIITFGAAVLGMASVGGGAPAAAQGVDKYGRPVGGFAAPGRGFYGGRYRGTWGRSYYGRGYYGRPAYGRSFYRRGYYWRPYYARPYFGPPYWYGSYYGPGLYWGYSPGAVAVAGIAGLAGALVGGAIANQPRTADPDYIAYCSRRYRSFDPVTGTFLGYDGRRHPCRLP